MNLEGELVDLVDEFSDGRIQFAFLKVKDSNSGLPKSVLIGWVCWTSWLKTRWTKADMLISAEKVYRREQKDTSQATSQRSPSYFT
jgi:hypothetical protein